MHALSYDLLPLDQLLITFHHNVVYLIDDRLSKTALQDIQTNRLVGFAGSNRDLHDKWAYSYFSYILQLFGPFLAFGLMDWCVVQA